MIIIILFLLSVRINVAGAMVKWRLSLLEILYNKIIPGRDKIKIYPPWYVPDRLLYSDPVDSQLKFKAKLKEL